MKMVFKMPKWVLFTFQAHQIQFRLGFSPDSAGADSSASPAYICEFVWEGRDSRMEKNEGVMEG